MRVLFTTDDDDAFEFNATSEPAGRHIQNSDIELTTHHLLGVCKTWWWKCQVSVF